jgi:hypothetical protein
MKFRSRPSTCEAVQFTDPADPPHGVFTRHTDGAFYVFTMHGQRAEVVLGDWIIAEPMPGRYYPCKQEVFERRWEAATD